MISVFSRKHEMYDKCEQNNNETVKCKDSKNYINETTIQDRGKTQR